MLHIKPKLHDITVSHDVVLSFHAHSAVSAGFSNAAVLDQVIVTHDLGLDKASLKIGVNDTGRPGGRRRPGSVTGPRVTPWNSREVEVVTPEGVRVILTAARPLDPNSAQAEGLRRIGIEAPEA